MSDPMAKDFFQINSAYMQRLQKRSVHLQRPRLMCLYYSDGVKHLDAKQIKYLRIPALSEYPIDLNLIYDNYRQYRDREKGTKLSLTLKHVISSAGTVASIGDCGTNEPVDRTSVYAQRGALRYIMQFCYAGLYDSNILVSRQCGDLYMFGNQVHGKNYNMKPEHTHHDCLGQHLFVDHPEEMPKFDEPYDSNVGFSAVHQNRIGKFDITVSGEMQGIMSEGIFDKFDDIDALGQQRFVMAKQIWSNVQNKDTKFLNFWLQAYLSNVDDLFLAYKDDNGYVREPIQHLKVSDLPKLKGINRYWKVDVCTAFLHDFLERVELLMKNVNSFQTVYEFNFKAKPKSITYQIHEGNPDKKVIPEEYEQFIKNQTC